MLIPENVSEQFFPHLDRIIPESIVYDSDTKLLFKKIQRIYKCVSIEFEFYFDI